MHYYLKLVNFDGNPVTEELIHVPFRPQVGDVLDVRSNDAPQTFHILDVRIICYFGKPGDRSAVVRRYKEKFDAIVTVAAETADAFEV